ncbi:MAG TPA: 16S rRNA (adenine(1518)-N(6)/adenine(1519)-N(6))-dimethyltransferase RsmA [Bacteroidota bacterium]|jgi:16S rRNA (adenine1518-N6/adenine1519-N6)-dimethyltransferase|nr:16S rRNA (adenine(1518)-N(6)/adenine(1519)-N(6))-dimethyltransferase RsmA [Bacteroidota bacterium]
MNIVKPRQSLGQNFLIDDNIARNIIRELHLSPDDVVIEIGPGHGALTRHLAGQTRHLVAMEIDGRVIGELKTEFSSQGVEILHQDFLEADLQALSSHYRRRIRIVGNIPYHLTSPILFKVFEESRAVQDITMMVQREVAQRIVAGPGSKAYGILSVVSRLYGEPKQLFRVTPHCFYPKPKVTSTVVQLTLHDGLHRDIDVELFRNIVRTTFGKRRKTLRNGLKYLPYDEDVVERIISETTIDLDQRPEELTVENFIGLTKEIQQIVT